jgi:hypothetical protein
MCGWATWSGSLPLYSAIASRLLDFGDFRFCVILGDWRSWSSLGNLGPYQGWTNRDVLPGPRASEGHVASTLGYFCSSAVCQSEISKFSVALSCVGQAPAGVSRGAVL